MVNLNWIYEEEDPNRLIDDKKLELVNKHIRTTWNLDWQPDLDRKIRNIELTCIKNYFNYFYLFTIKYSLIL